MKIEWTKLIALILVDAGVIFLGYFRVIESQAIVAVLSASLGYVFGNSHRILELRGSREYEITIQKRKEEDV